MGKRPRLEPTDPQPQSSSPTAYPDIVPDRATHHHRHRHHGPSVSDFCDPSSSYASSSMLTPPDVATDRIDHRCHHHYHPHLPQSVKQSSSHTSSSKNERKAESKARATSSPSTEIELENLDETHNDTNGLYDNAPAALTPRWRYPDTALTEHVASGYTHRERQMLVRILQIFLAAPLLFLLNATQSGVGYKQVIDQDLGDGRYTYRVPTSTQQAATGFLFGALFWVGFQFIGFNLGSLYRLWRFRRNPSMEGDHDNFFIAYTGRKYLKAIGLLSCLNAVFLFAIIFDTSLLLGKSPIGLVVWTTSQGIGIGLCVVTAMMLFLQVMLVHFIGQELDKFDFLSRPYYG